jgi:putative transcriptional regulator
MIINNVPRLLAEKHGGKENINLKKIQAETGLAYSSIGAWAKGHVDRFDTKALNAWCKYLDCQPGDILVYEPDKD